MENELTIAACQLVDIQADIDKALGLVISYAKAAEGKGASLVCYPECFLQGYEVSSKTRDLAIDLNSSSFQNILHQLRTISPMLVIGLIEIEDNLLFNTAIVVQHGQLLGRYRKVNLLKGEQEVFKAGSDYPIFDLGKLQFGINICYDMNFSNSVQAIATQGAQFVVCPSNNMMRQPTAKVWKHKHIESRSERAKEANIAILSSDVTGYRGDRVSYGPTAFIDNNGIVIKQIPLQEEGLLVHMLTV